jgi:ElaB/YqjD/DUF883 family membrane-anchored ribosome-binding protein
MEKARRVASTVHSGSHLAKEANESARKKIHHLTDKLAGLSDEAIDKLSEKVESLQTHGKEYKETVEDYVQKNPLKAVGFAVLAGAVLAALLRSK